MGAVSDILLSSTIGRNKRLVPGEVISAVINGTEEFLQNIEDNITVAVMGCSVNGPGEAREADIGIAGGIKEGLLFKKGEIIKKVPQEKIVGVLKQEILNMI